MNQNKINELIKALLIDDTKSLHEIIDTLHPADILEAIINRKDAYDLLEKLPNEIIAEVLDEADEEDQYELLKKFSITKQREIVNLMSSDEIADLIEELEGTHKTDVINLLDIDARKDVERLLKYDSESAGGIMTTEFLAIFEDKTIESALRYIRSAIDVETAHYVYVVDRSFVLKGVVSLRDIVTNPLETKIAQIMHQHVIYIHDDEDQEEVSHRFEKYGYAAMPVVDKNLKLVGVITVDDVLEVMVEETTEDIHHLAGINKEEKVDGSLLASIRSRLPWLCINLLTASLSSSIINAFNQTIAQIVVLSAVMTIISGMGGNAGTQSLTLVVRGLSLGEIDRSNAKSIILKEMGVGLFIGCIIGTFVSILCYFYGQNILLGVLAGVAMLLNMTCAVTAGCIVPLILEKLNVDPALASGVFVTGISDCLGFTFFLGLVTLALPLLT